MKREGQRLEHEVTSDNVFNFVVTAHHLCDWAKSDPTVPQPVKRRIDEIREHTEMKVCRDLANASKHFELSPKKNPHPTVASAESTRGWGVGRYGAGAFGFGEESVTITLCDQTTIDILPLMRRVVALWDEALGCTPAAGPSVPGARGGCRASGRWQTRCHETDTSAE